MSRQSIRLLRFVESLAGQAVYVGVDVHKRSYWVALFSAEDGQIETYSCPACVESFVNQLRTRTNQAFDDQIDDECLLTRYLGLSSSQFDGPLRVFSDFGRTTPLD